MESEVYRARIIARQSLSNVKPELKVKKEKIEKVKEEGEKINSASKVVLCYVGKKVVAEYDSLTKCATALSMTRAMVKKAIDNGVVLENGFKLVLKS
jgi:hypothetical protein